MGKDKTNTASATKRKPGTESSAAEKTAKTGSTKKQKTLDDLFEEGLRDIYNAEKQLLEALPEMAEAAYSEDLQNALNEHLHETKRQSERLEKIFDRLRMDKNQEEKCEAMEGLVKEARQILEEFEESPVRDSALIIAAQKVEHYEIASYGSLCELADVLGYSKIADLLSRSLDEEEAADKNLTVIAQDVNDEACELSYEEEGI